MTTSSAPSIRRRADSTKMKLLWKVIAYKIKNVRATENFEKSVKLLRRKKVLAKLLECNAGPAVVGPLLAASEYRARPMTNMEWVAPNMFQTRSMTWVRNNNPTRTRETRKMVPAWRTRHDITGVCGRGKTITQNNHL